MRILILLLIELQLKLLDSGKEAKSLFTAQLVTI
jgi:hypothetical protein